MASAPRHFVLSGDSIKLKCPLLFDLILTSPPFFHPAKTNPKHGYTPPTRRACFDYSQTVGRAVTLAPG